MKKRTIIAITLLILSITCTIIGVVIIQDYLTTSMGSSNLRHLKMSFSSSGYLAISLLIFQSIICSGFWLIIKKNSTKNGLDIDVLEVHTNAEEDNITTHSQELASENVDVIALSSQAIRRIKTAKKSQKQVGENILRSLAEILKITQGIIYIADSENKKLSLLSGYAYYKKESTSFEFGEGLAGQVAKAQRVVNIQSIPAGYIKTVSGLGESTPTNLLICPIIREKQTIGVLELASFNEFERETEKEFQKVANLIADKLNETKA